MTTQQLVLSLVLATMVFSVALELQLDDFLRVATPAGGKRFLQKAQGYIGTWVAGEAVVREGQVTGARPGKLVRVRA